MTKKQNYYSQLLLGFLSLFLIGIIFGSCEAEKDFANDTQGKFIIKRCSMKDAALQSNPKLMKAVNKLKGLQIKNNDNVGADVNARIVHDEKSGLYYDDEKGIYVEKDGKESYNFPVVQTDNNEKIKNITFNKNANNDYDVYIVKYDYTKEDTHNYSKEVLAQREIKYQVSIKDSVEYPLESQRVTCTYIVVTTTEHYENHPGEGPGGGDLTFGCGITISESYHCSFYLNEYSFQGTVTPGGGGPTGGAGSTPVPVPVPGNNPTPPENLPNNSILTAAVVDEGHINNPCEELQAKDEDSIFNAKMVELKGKAASQNFESSYIMYQNAVEGTTFSNELTGTPAKKEVNISFQNNSTQSYSNAVNILHCHLDDGSTFKVFSFSDIIALGEIANYSTRDKSELAINVTTSSGTFALKVKDKIVLRNNLAYMKLMYKPFEEEFKSFVKMTDNLQTQKLNFLQFINDMPGIGNPGIDLYEKNATTGKWNKLTLSSNGNNIQETPCN